MTNCTRAGALALALGTSAFGWIGAASAAPTITISPTTFSGSNIGKVALSTPATAGVFRVAAATGNVTVQSGALTRVGGATVTVPTFTINCVGSNGSNNRCGPSGSLTSVAIAVSRVTSSGSAFLPAMNVSYTALTAGISCTNTAQNATTVTVTCSNIPQGANNETIPVVSLKVGMDIQVGPTATPVGLQTLNYTATTTP